MPIGVNTYLSSCYPFTNINAYYIKHSYLNHKDYKNILIFSILLKKVKLFE